MYPSMVAVAVMIHNSVMHNSMMQHIDKGQWTMEKTDKEIMNNGNFFILSQGLKQSEIVCSAYIIDEKKNTHRLYYTKQVLYLVTRLHLQYNSTLSTIFVLYKVFFCIKQQLDRINGMSKIWTSSNNESTDCQYSVCNTRRNTFHHRCTVCMADIHPNSVNTFTASKVVALTLIG